MRAFRTFLGGSDMMAYLAMMAPRLVELRRVLKDTGSIYLHCDPTASHYLKILMDAVFGPQFFKNEIIWKRTSSHTAGKRWGDIHDTIFFFHEERELGPGTKCYWSTQKNIPPATRVVTLLNGPGPMTISPPQASAVEFGIGLARL